MLRLYQIPLFIIISTVLVSCAGVARISDFPKSYQAIDFEDIAKQNYEYDGSTWNQKTEYEYYLEVQSTDEGTLFSALSEALKRNGYKISSSDIKARTIIGERGLRMNEWNSITGIYYTINKDVFQVFIKNAITQDITGGWRENRAKKIANVLCTELIQCKK